MVSADWPLFPPCFTPVSPLFLKGAVMSVEHAVRWHAKRYFPHLMRENRDDNLLEVSQTTWILEREGLSFWDAIDRACYLVSRALGFRRIKTAGRGWIRTAGTLPGGEYGIADRVGVRSDGEYVALKLRKQRYYQSTKERWKAYARDKRALKRAQANVA